MAAVLTMSQLVHSLIHVCSMYRLNCISTPCGNRNFPKPCTFYNSEVALPKHDIAENENGLRNQSGDLCFVVSFMVSIVNDLWETGWALAFV